MATGPAAHLSGRVSELMDSPVKSRAVLPFFIWAKKLLGLCCSTSFYAGHDWNLPKAVGRSSLHKRSIIITLLLHERLVS